jgi:hypothetical protein
MSFRQIIELNYDDLNVTDHFMDSIFIPWGVVSTLVLFFVAFVGA